MPDRAFVPCLADRESCDTEITGNHRLGDREGAALHDGSTIGQDLLFAGMVVEKSMLRPPEAGTEQCFLTQHFKGRYRVAQTDMPTLSELQQMANGRYTPVPAAIEYHQGHTYHMLAAKVFENGQSYFQKKYAIKWYFVRSPTLEELCEELDGVADFAALPDARKAAARLELLLSSTKAENIFHVDPGLFETITEAMGDNGESMQDGCGFMPDDPDILQQLFGRSARNAVALQVRIIAPTLGIFKGMLMRKSGIGRIQLPASMHKVGRGRCPPASTAHSLATVVVLQFHPSKTRRDLQKTLDPGVGGTGTRQVAQDMPISKMPKRFLAHKGVPSSLLANNRSQHCFLVGVADPTGALPEGHVFVTGVECHDEVFVTRCPCVEPGDGRVFPVPMAKPTGMSNTDWDWLRGLQLGIVIFSTQGTRPMPLQCADGDLDGDYYFVCWNPDIVGFCKSGKAADAGGGVIKEEVVEEDTGEDGWDQGLASFAGGAGTSPRDSKAGEAAWERAAAGKGCWLAQVQEHLRDVGAIKQESRAICKFYGAWDKAVRELGMTHPDTIAYAKAYKQSLEYGKHGGKIVLPGHLPDPRYPAKKAPQKPAPPAAVRTEERGLPASEERVRQNQDPQSKHGGKIVPDDHLPDPQYTTETPPQKPAAPAAVRKEEEGCLPSCQEGARLHQELQGHSVQQLRCLIDAENLRVSKAIGGTKKRLKHQMVEEIVEALIQKSKNGQ